eukprot:Colp12_sorted_trinity150504_noHs@62
MLLKNLAVTIFLFAAVAHSFVDINKHVSNYGDGHDDEGHLKEHLKDVYNEEQLAALKDENSHRFHYFKLHDTNNDDKLDGLELRAALSHSDHPAEKKSAEEKENAEKALTQMVDHTLQEDDLDNDGFISFVEYELSLKAHAA